MDALIYICMTAILVGCVATTIRALHIAKKAQERLETESEPVGYLLVESTDENEPPSILMEFTKSPDRLRNGQYISLIVKFSRN